ncbi:hypothetical protein KIN20_014651 [Parelaphostrongylus tenuis]|uniref:Uncharacterized protein n=1 Tax=Parelaphostrongylus tenuis TaxID=148309 RepID=A0AAD5MDW0_PARTN|nr:hypothetical protein KIN20_014651 [Parelaphostrongylus tenuis]
MDKGTQREACPCASQRRRATDWSGCNSMVAKSFLKLKTKKYSLSKDRKDVGICKNGATDGTGDWKPFFEILRG